MKKLLIANWKMRMSSKEERAWLAAHLTELEHTRATTDHDLVICPSFTTLDYATQTFPSQHWGAQTCGFQERGAYTGDVSVISLKELGIQYCLVGHYEQRLYHTETNEQIAQKIVLLKKNGIEPILCIGEPLETRDQRAALEEQLTLRGFIDSPLIIAYEPLSALGTQRVPSFDELDHAVGLIRALAGSKAYKILYGGSVTPESAARFTALVQGFLIGKASLDPLLLKKIILSC